MELLTAFYVGAGTTAAFALCLFTWIRAKHDTALNDAHDEGFELGLEQNVQIRLQGQQGRSSVVEGRVPPSFIDETMN